MTSENSQAHRKQQNKSGKTMNRIELCIFGAMTIYVFVVIFMYLNSEPIKGYEIQMGSLSVAKTYTGIALREEEILQSPYTGYINYYIREGERVSSRDTVYSIDESGKLASLLNSGDLGENTYTDEELAQINEQYKRVKKNYNIYDFDDVLKYIK